MSQNVLPKTSNPQEGITNAIEAALEARFPDASACWRGRQAKAEYEIFVKALSDKPTNAADNLASKTLLKRKMLRFKIPKAMIRQFFKFFNSY